MAGQGKGKGGAKKHGRDKPRCKLYRDMKTREKRKIVNIAESSGLKAALEYAAKWNLSDFARTRLRKFHKFAVQLQ